MTTPLLRIASRGSPLALAQARLTRAKLAAHHSWKGDEIEALCPILTFKTTGDRIQDRPLAEAGGKGLFVKEIEEALIEGIADLAVHSSKDLPAVQPSGLDLIAVLEREDPRDVFIARERERFDDLPIGARIGTSSVRRQAQALRARPDLAFCGLRGNVETRLAKIRGGEADATFLALAGLNRLGIHLDGAEILDDETWLPALCQGAIGLEARAGDTRVQGLVSGIDHPASHLAVICERAFLAALNGSCRTPIAGLARLAGNRLEFRGEVLRRDGRDSWTSSRATDVLADPIMARRAAALMGASAASDIKSMAGADMPHF